MIYLTDMIKFLNKGALLEIAASRKFLVVDLREPAAFNGWRLEGEIRGGHIPGAINRPLGWWGGVGGDALSLPQQILEAAEGRSIVLYGYHLGSCLQAAEALDKQGSEVAVYNEDFRVWAAEPELPLVHLPNFEKLVYPGWLARSRANSGASDKDVMIFEAGFNGHGDYLQGHIPEAAYLELNLLEKKPLWNIVPPAELEAVLHQSGITRDKTVVIYSRRPYEAARLALILMYAGVSDVRMLDGGFNAWIAGGYPLEAGEHIYLRAAEFGGSIPGRPELVIGLDRVRSLLADPEASVACVRSWDEYSGLTSGYDFIQARGHIPGSVWAGAIGSELFLNQDGTVRNWEEIADFWRARGLSSDRKTAFYCGTGWRASEAYFYAHLMGWRDICIYDGGWLEWSRSRI